MWYRSCGIYSNPTWHEGEENEVRTRLESKGWGEYQKIVPVEYITTKCGYGAHGSSYRNNGKLSRKTTIKLSQRNICAYCKRRVAKEKGIDLSVAL